MGTIKFAIGLGVIALALIFLTFRRFGVPAITELGDALGQGIESTGKGLEGISKGISDFFNSFDGTNNSGIEQDPTKQTDSEQKELFGKKLTGDEELLINYNDNPDILTETEKRNAEKLRRKLFKTDPNNDPSKFNPPNTKYNKDNPYGYDNSENQITKLIDSIIPEMPQVYAQKYVFSSKPNQKKTGKTSISGSVRSELETDQKFTATSSDSSRPVRGTIRKTKQDPRKLQTNSKKNPVETASQRANRVFKETGKFADEDRGATSAKTKTKGFDFGTNTGSGLRIATGAATSNKRKSQRLKDEAKKATKHFDSGSISNW